MMWAADQQMKREASEPDKGVKEESGDKSRREDDEVRNGSRKAEADGIHLTQPEDCSRHPEGVNGFHAATPTGPGEAKDAEATLATTLEGRGFRQVPFFLYFSLMQWWEGRPRGTPMRDGPEFPQD